MTTQHTVSRRQFLISTAAVGGSFILGFCLPLRAASGADVAAQPWTPPVEGGQEVNAWLVIGSDDTVTIRVAQSEMGQGVFTSLPMIVAEELECDWTKVRAEYASANRSLRDMLYASVMVCPVFGGKLKSYNFDAIKSLPGVQAAVEVPNGIAVVADSFWRAKTALEVMPVEWDFGAYVNTNSTAFQDMFR